MIIGLEVALGILLGIGLAAAAIIVFFIRRYTNNK